MTDDPFARHEILDRASIIMDSIDRHLVERDDLKPDERVLAEASFRAMFDFYQLVGRNTLGDEREEIELLRKLYESFKRIRASSNPDRMTKEAWEALDKIEEYWQKRELEPEL